MQKKLISIVTPCYNEELNIEKCYNKVKLLFQSQNLQSYNYEHIFVDNSSTDSSQAIMRSLAKVDKNVKVIINSRNFGANRSVYNGIISSGGDAVVELDADLQDPPEMIIKFVKKWEEGFDVVYGIRKKRKEGIIINLLRKIFYKLVNKISTDSLPEGAGDFRLIDKKIVKYLHKYIDNEPYFRGAVANIGFNQIGIEYSRELREAGETKANLFSYIDYGMNGLTKHSSLPLRAITIIGFIFSFLSMALAIIYLIYKIMYWDSFALGIAPAVISTFFFASIQLFVLGILGEYISAIYTEAKNRPLVIEKERLNFE